MLLLIRKKGALLLEKKDVTISTEQSISGVENEKEEIDVILEGNEGMMDVQGLARKDTIRVEKRNL